MVMPPVAAPTQVIGIPIPNAKLSQEDRAALTSKVCLGRLQTHQAARTPMCATLPSSARDVSTRADTGTLLASCRTVS
jgi:hypothetical protein